MADNRSVVTSIMAALAQGDGRPFIDAMADDFCWILEGSTPWSGRYQGKDAVRQKLFAPLFAQFATQYRNRAERIVVDGDDVVVACRGTAETVRGERYDNSYCYWIRMRGGRMVELREYLDTALVERVIEPPAQNDRGLLTEGQ